ncbi:hypothetical protein TKK_0011678 [Trichogramma kaykai]
MHLWKMKQGLDWNQDTYLKLICTLVSLDIELNEDKIEENIIKISKKVYPEWGHYTTYAENVHKFITNNIECIKKDVIVMRRGDCRGHILAPALKNMKQQTSVLVKLAESDTKVAGQCYNPLRKKTIEMSYKKKL